ncbi:MAG: isoprenylcysteine carboxylmethyltransferase family protein [Myxococcaceae bacterium]|nr:isoprenylcysteine carboxylmethyltransferase family protein [Myxococcaceae bacterium]
MNAQDSGSRPDNAGVVAPPPALFGTALAAGLVLHWLRPLPFSFPFPVRAAGGALVVAGLVLSVLVMRHFRRANTPVVPWGETRRLVISGPYRFSRNPDYLGQAFIVAGVGLLFGALWVFVLLVPALLLVRYGVIAREERYLERRFGDEYRAFWRRVRRWL